MGWVKHIWQTSPAQWTAKIIQRLEAIIDISKPDSITISLQGPMKQTKFDDSPSHPFIMYDRFHSEPALLGEHIIWSTLYSLYILPDIVNTVIHDSWKYPTL